MRCGWPLSCWGMWRWLVGDVGRMESSVAVAGEDVTPPLGALVAGRAEHVEHLLADLGRLLLEVGAHGIEQRLARVVHLLDDLALLLERGALGRVLAELPSEVRHLLRLDEFIQLRFVDHGSPFPYVPKRFFGVLGCYKFCYK